MKAADGTYTYYTTLAAALAAAKNGDTVKLTQDITPDERIVVTGNKNITIDLAEKKITSTADVAIVNDGNGKLTITGNGTVDTSSSTNDENIAIWARTGSIDIENGTFINKSNKGSHGLCGHQRERERACHHHQGRYIQKQRRGNIHLQFKPEASDAERAEW